MVGKVRGYEKSRGGTLGTVLLVTFIAAMLTFTLATSSTFQLRVSSSLEAQSHAQNLAESAVHLAIAELSQQQDFGAGQETLDVPVDGYPEGSMGMLTFNASRASGEGCATSYNNLSSKDEKTAPDGFVIPGETVRLVGFARCGSSRAEVECLYYQPAFPVGLSSGGEVSGTGLYLAGLVEGTPFSGDPASLTPDQVRPADLVSNASSDTAVKLGPGCEVLGDVHTVGKAEIDDNAKVRGAIRTGSAPAPIPTFVIASVAGRLAAGNVTPANVPSGLSTLTVDYYSQASTDIEINGPLVMQGGVLYVKGDLTVNGPVSGGGAILAEGEIRVRASNDPASQGPLTLASVGKLTVVGSTSGGRYFRGLLYSDTEVDVNQVALTGSIISQGKTTVKEVDLIQTERSTTTVFGFPRRHENGDDTLFYRVDPVRDPGDPDTITYNYVAALYTAPWVTTNDKQPPYIFGDIKGQGKTRDQVISELSEFAGSDYQAYQATVNLSDVMQSELPAYLTAISSPQPADEFALSFDMGKLLAPAQRSRLLLWRNRQ